ncbi:hypothetical protein KDAU_08120 [Dictyobacter aurantiacus]|uniref:Uncharacterized protein n=1 Tax=Dictyobacter aurantiacus TaxID=1936993 RepID=A0A401Z9J6_9CHLR|nr:hypothetical protein KDAU_08120 [Dictyobacter aurantiacus]
MEGQFCCTHALACGGHEYREVTEGKRACLMACKYPYHPSGAEEGRDQMGRSIYFGDPVLGSGSGLNAIFQGAPNLLYSVFNQERKLSLILFVIGIS